MPPPCHALILDASEGKSDISSADPSSVLLHCCLELLKAQNLALNEGLPTCIHIIQHVIWIHAMIPQCEQWHERNNLGDEREKGGL